AYRDAREHYAKAGGAPAELYINALKVLMRIGSFRQVPTPAERAALAEEGQRVARATADPGTLARVLVYSAFRDMDPGSEAAEPGGLRVVSRVRAWRLGDGRTSRDRYRPPHEVVADDGVLRLGGHPARQRRARPGAGRPHGRGARDGAGHRGHLLRTGRAGR